MSASCSRPRRLIPRPASATLRLAFASEANSRPRQAIGSRARWCCQAPRCRVPLRTAMAGRSERADCRPDEAQAAVFGRTAAFRLLSPPPRASQTPEEAPLSSRWMRRTGSPPAIVLRLAAKRPASGRSLEGPRPLYHGRSAYDCDNAGPAMRSPRCWPLHDQPRPRSADRTRSPAAVSQKREYFKYPPETIGHFAPEVTKFGVWRPTTNSQKTAIGGHFWPCRRQNLNAPDWLAGAGGFEPPYGGIKIHCLTTWRRPNSVYRKEAGPTVPRIPFCHAGL